jgi:hypothetical protein
MLGERGRDSVHVIGLLVELVGHGFQNQSGPFVKVALSELTTMLGLAAKLKWSSTHAVVTNLG